MELNPSFTSTTNYGTISINRWGMRDQDYERTPPPGAFRMAILGPSNVMGWGVTDGATFEAIVEKRLNDRPTDMPFAKFEILNFAVPAYEPPQQLVALDKALGFKPRAVLYVATGREMSRANQCLIWVVQHRIEIPYEPLRAIIARAGIGADMDETTALKLLDPVRSDILRWTYGRIADESRRAGAVPVWIFLPQVTEGRWQEETPIALDAARAAGFVIIDLSDVYKGEDIKTLRLAEWDEHPNARAHELIAARLLEGLRAQKDAIFVDRAQ